MMREASTDNNDPVTESHNKTGTISFYAAASVFLYSSVLSDWMMFKKIVIRVLCR